MGPNDSVSLCSLLNFSSRSVSKRHVTKNLYRSKQSSLFVQISRNNCYGFVSQKKPVVIFFGLAKCSAQKVKDLKPKGIFAVKFLWINSAANTNVKFFVEKNKHG